MFLLQFSMLKHFNGSTQQKKKVKKMRNNIRKAYTAGEDEEPDSKFSMIHR
jgi:hypothetical protein